MRRRHYNDYKRSKSLAYPQDESSEEEEEPEVDFEKLLKELKQGVPPPKKKPEQATPPTVAPPRQETSPPASLSSESDDGNGPWWKRPGELKKPESDLGTDDDSDNDAMTVPVPLIKAEEPPKTRPDHLMMIAKTVASRVAEAMDKRYGDVLQELGDRCKRYHEHLEKAGTRFKLMEEDQKELENIIEEMAQQETRLASAVKTAAASGLQARQRQSDGGAGRRHSIMANPLHMKDRLLHMGLGGGENKLLDADVGQLEQDVNLRLVRRMGPVQRRLLLMLDVLSRLVPLSQDILFVSARFGSEYAGFFRFLRFKILLAFVMALFFTPLMVVHAIDNANMIFGPNQVFVGQMYLPKWLLYGSYNAAVPGTPTLQEWQRVVALGQKPGTDSAQKVDRYAIPNAVFDRAYYKCPVVRMVRDCQVQESLVFVRYTPAYPWQNLSNGFYTGDAPASYLFFTSWNATHNGVSINHTLNQDYKIYGSVNDARTNQSANWMPCTPPENNSWVTGGYPSVCAPPFYNNSKPSSSQLWVGTQAFRTRQGAQLDVYIGDACPNAPNSGPTVGPRDPWLALRYLFAVIGSAVFLFVLILTRWSKWEQIASAERLQSQLKPLHWSKLVLAAWDFKLQSEDKIESFRQSLATQLKALSIQQNQDKKEHEITGLRKIQRRAKRIAGASVNVFIILLGWAAIITATIYKDTAAQLVSNVPGSWSSYISNLLPNLVISLVGLILPYTTNSITALEEWSPDMRARQSLWRLFFGRIANVFIFIILTAELLGGQPVIRQTLTGIGIDSGSLASQTLMPRDCVNYICVEDQAAGALLSLVMSEFVLTSMLKPLTGLLSALAWWSVITPIRRMRARKAAEQLAKDAWAEQEGDDLQEPIKRRGNLMLDSEEAQDFSVGVSKLKRMGTKQALEKFKAERAEKAARQRPVSRGDASEDGESEGLQEENKEDEHAQFVQEYVDKEMEKVQVQTRFTYPVFDISSFAVDAVYFQLLLWVATVFMPALVILQPLLLFLHFKWLKFGLLHLMSKSYMADNSSLTAEMLQLLAVASFLFAVLTYLLLTTPMDHLPNCGPFDSRRSPGKMLDDLANVRGTIDQQRIGAIIAWLGLNFVNIPVVASLILCIMALWWRSNALAHSVMLQELKNRNERHVESLEKQLWKVNQKLSIVEQRHQNFGMKQ